jgi:hypothetical protein
MGVSKTGWYDGGNTANDPDSKKKALARAKMDAEFGKVQGYDQSVSMNLIFFDEIQRLSKSRINAPLFDMGIITEIIGTKNFKYKVKLADLGSVIIATGADSMAANFSWSKPKSVYLKGALVLVICVPSSYNMKNPTMSYQIVSVRQTGVYAPKPDEHPV